MSWLTQASTFTRRDIHRLYTSHTRNINDPPRRMRIRALEQQWLHSHRHIKDILDIQIIQLIPRMLGVIVVIVSPARARIVHQHRQTVGALLHLFAETKTAGLVLEIRNDVLACARAEGIEPVGGVFQLLLFARGDEDAGAVLHEGLRGHFAEAGGAAGDEDDMVGEVEEGGDAEVVLGGGVGHGGGGECGQKVEVGSDGRDALRWFLAVGELHEGK